MCGKVTITHLFQKTTAEKCADIEDFSNSINVEAFKIDDKFKTTRTFSILSIIASVGTFVVGCFAAIGVFGNTKTICIGLAISCCCQLVALSVFTDYYKDHTDLINNASFNGKDAISLEWAYVLGWVGFAIAGITCLIGFFMDI